MEQTQSNQAQTEQNQAVSTGNQQEQKQQEVHQNQVEIQDQQQKDHQNYRGERNQKYNNKYGGNRYNNNYKGKKGQRGPSQQQQQYYTQQFNNMINNYFNQLMAVFGTKAYLNKDSVYKYNNDFKRAANYRSMDSIVEAFPDLKNVNSEAFDVQSIQNARFFILRSNNDDDVHKAVKYGIWTSTPNSNVLLNTAYKEAKLAGIDVYLVFSVVKSGQFLGIAKLVSEFSNENFQFWFQRNKFLGHFKLQWNFLKDIPYKKFENIKNNEQKPIIRSKDCTEINYETAGKQLLEIFKEQANEPNIFGEFEFMDKREDLLRSYNTYLDNFQQNYTQQFYYQNEMSQYYYNQQYMQNGAGMYGQPQYSQYYQQMKTPQQGGQYGMGFQNPYANQYQQHMSGQQFQMRQAQQYQKQNPVNQEKTGEDKSQQQQQQQIQQENQQTSQ